MEEGWKSIESILLSLKDNLVQKPSDKQICVEFKHIGLIERALVCTPTTYFDEKAKEVLSNRKVTSFEVKFNNVYLDGIQIAIENIRNAQAKYFYNDHNESVLHLTIIDKVNELKNSKKE